MTSLSRTLLKRVLSIYFALTFLVTLVQVVAEFYSARSVIEMDMRHTIDGLQQGLAQAIWEINPEQENALVDGLLQLPAVVGVDILHHDDESHIRRGILPEQRLPRLDSSTDARSVRGDGRLFGIEAPLTYADAGIDRWVGTLTLYSSDQVTFERIRVSLVFLILNAMFKTALLIFMFLWVFRIYLSRPLASFAQQISNMDLHNLEKSHLHLQQPGENELTLLSKGFNRLVDKLIDNRSELDRHRALLAEEVERKTLALQQTLNEVEAREQSLASEVELRLQAEQELKASYAALKQSQGELYRAQDQLVASEKLNSLGQMVAEVTHELNTPIGVAITTSSYLENKMRELERGFKERSITSTQMEQFLAGGLESAELIRVNMQRAAELVGDFKLIAVDEASNRMRRFNLKEYLQGIVHSLHHKFKRTTHRIELRCEPDIELYCRPGSIAQILINLMMNSLVHGFESQEKGNICIEASKEGDDWVCIDYSDDGRGMSAEQLQRVFEPFFTTRPEQGGSGLGAHIVHKLVTTDLGGEISVDSEPGQGVHYRLRFRRLQENEQ
ncbi:ATP-binding protein [Aestuariirhabdus litorea]|uniref:histidine kinase n=1 Tax=Aestuariirhabdus litorea TaxID=2528527 RepID=A0A3P3VS30_9GAMM|nr:ATP-binding protein [Aestuariirhabdus litorea]RRJ83613.1 sensor histidine kinase [Aestuariirhabdus litorea]RWW96834.1 sensor histidine kinase [Endozoicomonadaceae bacterium GTF-13]